MVFIRSVSHIAEWPCEQGLNDHLGEVDGHAKQRIVPGSPAVHGDSVRATIKSNEGFHHSKATSAWWLTYPSEKYDFVSWDFLIPNIWKIQIVPSHQPGFDADLTNIGESSETLARQIEQK